VPLCGAAAVTAFAAAAQQPARLPDPTDASAGVPALKYESPFAGYTPYREPDLKSWQDANEAVRAAGGHKGMSAASGGSAAETGTPTDPQPAPSQAPGSEPTPAHGADHH